MVKLCLNGKRIGAGQFSDLFCENSCEAVGWPTSQPTEAEHGFIAGNLVVTGTITDMTPLAPGDAAEANFRHRGVVRAQFESL